MEIKRGYVFFDDGRKEPLFLHPELEATASDKQKAASKRLKNLVEQPAAKVKPFKGIIEDAE